MGPGHEWGDEGENPNPSTHTTVPNQDRRGKGKTQTQTHAPHNNRKPSIHSPGTKVARAIQATWLDVTRRPGVRLHSKACAALGLEAERLTPKHLETQVPRRCRRYGLGSGYARKSGELLGFRPKEQPRASAKAHPPRVGHSPR